MADHIVTISTDGTPTPDDIEINPGDRVTFQTAKADVVLCVDPTELFGAERFIIPAGDRLNVLVQDFAPPGEFAYLIITGNLDRPCKGRGGDGEGGGSVGGGSGGDGGYG